LVPLALRPDAARVAMVAPCHGCEADPGPLEIVGGMEPPERREESVDVSHVESGAIVAQAIDRFFIGRGRGELDLRLRLLAGELPRVLEEIFQGDAEKLGISLRHESVLDV